MVREGGGQLFSERDALGLEAGSPHLDQVLPRSQVDQDEVVRELLHGEAQVRRPRGGGGRRVPRAGPEAPAVQQDLGAGRERVEGEGGGGPDQFGVQGPVLLEGDLHGVFEGLVARFRIPEDMGPGEQVLDGFLVQGAGLVVEGQGSPRGLQADPDPAEPGPAEPFEDAQEPRIRDVPVHLEAGIQVQDGLQVLLDPGALRRGAVVQDRQPVVAFAEHLQPGGVQGRSLGLQDPDHLLEPGGSPVLVALGGPHDLGLQEGLPEGGVLGAAEGQAEGPGQEETDEGDWERSHVSSAGSAHRWFGQPE